MLNIGDKVKDFVLKDAKGLVHRLSDYLGKKVVLYFYPKDDTPGCTKQACSFRDVYSELNTLGVTVIGISKDDEKSHNKFATKYNLPFTLLSDPDALVATYFNAYGEKKMYGKSYMGIFRKTYVLNERQEIMYIFETASPETNAQEIIQLIKDIS